MTIQPEPVLVALWFGHLLQHAFEVVGVFGQVHADLIQELLVGPQDPEHLAIDDRHTVQAAVVHGALPGIGRQRREVRKVAHGVARQVAGQVGTLGLQEVRQAVQLRLIVEVHDVGDVVAGHERGLLKLLDEFFNFRADLLIEGLQGCVLIERGYGWSVCPGQDVHETAAPR